MRTDNGVTLSRSAVQVYGASLNDSPTAAPKGLTLATGGFVEARVNKIAGTNLINDVKLLIDNVGIVWGASGDRPKILETFRTAQGRAQQDAGGLITFGALPASTDAAFFNFGSAGAAATKANYANNVYFPRTTPDPQRCAGPIPPGGYPTTESIGIVSAAGNWQTGTGVGPHTANGGRLHSDGDTSAGGPGGVACPGSMGYRVADVRNYRFANLARWFTQDRVNQTPWGGSAGRDQIRRGFITFGQVSDPAAVPVTGTANYPNGYFWGFFSFDNVSDPVEVVGDLSITVDFATRAVTYRLTKVRNLATGTEIAPALNLPSVATSIGAAGTVNANYFTASVSTGTGFTGGLGGRLFGDAANPVNEIGGVLRLSGGSNPGALIAGFIALAN